MTRTPTGPLRRVDVPQSDSLPTIRVIVAHVEAAAGNVATISELTGVSDRHVRYRLQAARVLGFVNEDRTITRRGRSLLATRVGSDAEHETLIAAVNACRV